MSKNFELLQQVGDEQKLFQTSGNLGQTVATRPKPERASDQEIPNRVFGVSTLPWRLPDLLKAKAGTLIRRSERTHAYALTDRDAITREEELKLIQRIFPVGANGGPQVVVFSGIDGEAGCAAICARTGELLAAGSEGPVCVADAAFRSPALHRAFGMDNLRGLANAVVEAAPIREFAQQLPGCNLWVITSGQTSRQAGNALYADRLRSRLAELRATFKFVVIHSSLFDPDSGSMSIARLTDGVVLVVEANSTLRERARRVKKHLDVAGVRLLGVVLNNRTYPIPEAIYRRL